MEKNLWILLNKYFQQRATTQEIAELENWLEKDEKNPKIIEEAFNLFATAGFCSIPLNPDMDKAWRKIDKRTTIKYNTKKIFRQIKYAAAIAILLVAVSFLLLKNNQLTQQYTEIVTHKGQKSVVVLPDSSLVWLNSCSSLKYNGNFNLRRREVILNGEAFFEVQKNKSKKFSVKTGMLNINVYGTSFNIKNHKDDDVQEITVADGRVGISDKNREIKQLVKGDRALFNKQTNKIAFSKISPDIVSIWKNNELVFDNTPIKEAIKYMERWYGVNISIDNEMVGKHNYTFNIKTESFREMLELMKIMTPLSYEINGKDVTIKYAN